MSGKHSLFHLLRICSSLWLSDVSVSSVFIFLQKLSLSLYPGVFMNLATEIALPTNPRPIPAPMIPM
jgi:hypothetical protein